MSSDPERARETSHPLCARQMWSPADPSLCPRGRCNVSMRCGLQRSNGNNNTYQDMSPLDVRIWLSLRNLQQLRYPVCPGNSRLTRTAPSRFFKLNKKIVSEVSTCIPETLTCRLSRCYPDRRKRRSCPRERRRRSWPRRTSGEWRAPCWSSKSPTRSAYRLGRQIPGFWSLRPSASRTPWQKRSVNPELRINLSQQPYLGQVSPQCSPCSHLDPADGLHTHSGLRQVGVTRCFPSLPDGVLEVLRLLPQLFQFVHLGCGLLGLLWLLALLAPWQWSGQVTVTGGCVSVSGEAAWHD